MANYPEVAGFIVKVVGQVLNIGVTVIIFVLIFKVLPDAKIKSKDVFIGAVVTTLLLLVGQWGISFYIGIANVGTIYGAAAFMVVLLHGFIILPLLSTQVQSSLKHGLMKWEAKFSRMNMR